MELPLLINILKALFLLNFITLKAADYYSFSLNKTRKITLLITVFSFFRLNNLAVYNYIRPLSDNISFLTLSLITSYNYISLKRDNQIKRINMHLEYTIIAITGIIFYPLTLGVNSFDPYSLSFNSPILISAILFFQIVLFIYKRFILLVALTIALTAYFLKLSTSLNVWDYIIDPIIVFYAIFSLIKPLFQYSWIKNIFTLLTNTLSSLYSKVINFMKTLLNTTNKLPKTFQFILLSSLSLLMIFSLFRIGFYLYFMNTASKVPLLVLFKSLIMGLRFDLRLALIIHVPIVLLMKSRYFSLYNQIKKNNIWSFILTIAFAVMIFIYFADFGYYAYLQTSRIDATSLRFLLNPLISFTMLWESYPVFWIILFYLLTVAVYFLFIQKIYSYTAANNNSQIKGKRKFFVNFTFVALIIFGMYGKFAYYPLRWSNAFFSKYYFASVVTLNPVLYFFETFKNREIQYDLDKVEKYYPKIAEFVGADKKANEEYKLTRYSTYPTSNDLEKPNIVVIILESFAHYKTGFSGNPLNPTPNFDKLAKDGILFNNFYSPHGGTARSVFTLLTGIPDIEKNSTSSRNPTVVNQRTILNSFKNHEKYYFLGGSANWGNIRGLLQNNIPELKLYEDGSYSSPRNDVWGISDLHLFEETNFVLREEKKPFFAIIHTAGNHKPYTIPKDNRGFKAIEPKFNPEDYGFRSAAAYNAFRFMDHSLGIFFEKARKEKYFDNTMFVLLADHGLLRKADHMSKAINELGITDFQNQLLIYYPKQIKEGKVISRTSSEVDVLPTIAGLTKTSYKNTTFGRDLLDEKNKGKNYAFTITHYAIHEIGLLSDDFYFRANADGSNKNLYQLHTNTPTENVLTSFPKVASEMDELCYGIYETARYIRYHNSEEGS